MDYAVFLSNLKDDAPRCVGMVPFYQWPGAHPMALSALAKQTRETNLLFAAMLDDDAEDPDIESALAHFPKGLRIQADLSALPGFKSVSILPDPSLLAESHVGFTSIDFGVEASVRQGGIRVPLVAGGPNGELVASLPLLVAVEAMSLPWDQVRMKPGEVLHLGEDSNPIAVDASGQMLLPLQRPPSLHIMSGETMLAPANNAIIPAPIPLKDAVVIVGDDRDEKKLFSLPSGKRLSRAELIARTVHALLHPAVATPPVPAPAPPPTPEIDVSPAADRSRPSATAIEAPVDYKFPDPRASNIGVWILGIAWALLIGFSLLQKHHAPEIRTSPVPTPTRTKPNPVPSPPSPKRKRSRKKSRRRH